MYPFDIQSNPLFKGKIMPDYNGSSPSTSYATNNVHGLKLLISKWYRGWKEWIHMLNRDRPNLHECIHKLLKGVALPGIDLSINIMVTLVSPSNPN